MTVLFTTSPSILSRFIRWFTRSQVSHVGIGTTLHGVPVVIHADVGGVQVSTRTKFLQRRILHAEYDHIRQPSDLHMSAAVLAIGEGYDYLGLFGFAIVILAWRWLRLRLHNPFASPRAVVCSEFVARALSVPGISDVETVSPQVLLEACATSSHFSRSLT